MRVRIGAAFLLIVVVFGAFAVIGFARHDSSAAWPALILAVLFGLWLSALASLRLAFSDQGIVQHKLKYGLVPASRVYKFDDIRTVLSGFGPVQLHLQRIRVLGIVNEGRPKPIMLLCVSKLEGNPDSDTARRYDDVLRRLKEAVEAASA